MTFQSSPKPLDEDIFEDDPPEDVSRAIPPPAKEISRRPLTPPEWDRRLILIVAMVVWALAIIGSFLLIALMPSSSERAAWLVTAVTGVIGPIVGFYFAKPRR